MKWFNFFGDGINRSAGFAVLLLLLCSLSAGLPAAVITWGPPTTVSGDSDVATAGSPVYAYDWANATATVNGTTFTGVSTETAGSVATTFNSVNTSTFTSTSSPFSALSTAYKTMLVGSDYYPAVVTVSVTLNNLVIGHVYAVQIWVQDPRGPEYARQETVTSTGGNTVTLDYSSASGGTSGGVGQFTVGTFTADGTIQTFYMTALNTGAAVATQLNALQLRDVTGLNDWGGYVNGGWDYATTNWGAGLAMTAVTNFTGAVTFADTNSIGGAVINSSVTVQAQGVSVSAVNFVNNTLPYTIGDATGSAIGITGPAAVNILGPAPVTFTGTNTYAGVTTIAAVNGATLALTNNGSIASSAELVLNGGTFDVRGVTNFTLGASQPATFAGGFMTASNLTLDGAVITNTVLAPGTPLISAGTLNFTANASLLAIESISPPASYPAAATLMPYTNFGGTLNMTLVLPPGYAGFVTNYASAVTLVLTSGPLGVTWRGSVDGNWDTTTTNWVNTSIPSQPALYSDNSPVIYDDTATGTANVILSTTVAPQNVTISASSLTYQISGNGQMTGPMTLTKSGSATATILTTNGYTGGTILNGGSLIFGSGGLGSGNITINGGTVEWFSGNTQDISTRLNPIPNSVVAALDIPAANTVTFTSGIAGQGGIAIVDSGTLILGAAGTYSGGTTIGVGTLRLNNAGAAGFGSILDGGVLTLAIGGGTLTNTVSGAGTINEIETANNNTYLGGPMTNFTGMINCPASGSSAKVCIINPIANLSSAATVNVASGGTLFLATLVNVGASVTVAGAGNSEGFGAIRLDSGSSISGPVTMLASSTFGNLGGASGVISGPIGDGGHGYNFTRVGPAGDLLTLSGTNTYSGATIINGGTLVLASTGSISNSSGIQLGAGTAFNVLALAGGFVLGPSQTLSATNGQIIGSFKAGSSQINLTCTAGIPALTITNGQFTLNGNHFAINVSGAALLPGTNVLIATTGGVAPGTIAGSISGSQYVISGGGVANLASLQMTPAGLALVVMPFQAPILTSFTPAGANSFQLNFHGPLGQSYSVLYSTNLTTPLTNWTRLTGGTFGFQNVQFTDSNATNSPRFYVIRAP